MESDSIRPTDAKPQRNEAALKTPASGDAQASQRTADAAAKRVSPPDQAEISPRARALAEQEAATEKPQQQDQRRVDERRSEQRQVDAQRAASQQAAQRFETVA